MTLYDCSQVSLKVGSCSDLHARAGPFDVDVVFQHTVRGLHCFVVSHRNDSRTSPLAICRRARGLSDAVVHHFKTGNACS